MSTDSENNDDPDYSSNLIDEDSFSQDELNEMEDEMPQVPPEDVRVNNQLMREYISEGSPEWKEATIRNYTGVCRYFLEYTEKVLGGKDLMDITQKEISGFYTHGATKLNSRVSTLQVRVSALSGFYEHCQISDEVDPVLSKSQVKYAFSDQIKAKCREKLEREPISREELSQLYDACESKRQRLIIRFTYETGGRNSDIRGVKTSDIDLSDGTVRFRNSKGGKDYSVPLRHELVIRLRQWMNNRRDVFLDGRDSEFLFPGKRSEKLGLQQLVKLVDRAAQAAGIQEVTGTVRNPNTGEAEIKRVTPHTLRHSIITHLANDNVDLKYRQMLAGHSDPMTTEQVYTHDDDTAFDILRSEIK